MTSAAEQFASNINLASFAKAEELKKRLLFTLGALIIYRIGTYVPLPGIDPAAFEQSSQCEDALASVVQVDGLFDSPRRRDSSPVILTTFHWVLDRGILPEDLDHPSGLRTEEPLDLLGFDSSLFDRVVEVGQDCAPLAREG